MTKIEINGSVFITHDMLDDLSEEVLNLMLEGAIEDEDYEHAEILKRKLNQKRMSNDYQRPD